MKTCGRCKIEKDDSDFRVRKESRASRPFDYLNNDCLKCDKERAAIYYAKKKDDEAFKEKNRNRVRQYVQANPEKIKMRRTTKEYLKKHAQWELNRYYRIKDVIASKMKSKRQTPEYKAMMKAYRTKNKEKIYQQEVITKKRYHEKHRDNCTDKYIARQLANQKMVESAKTANKLLIEAKRIQILIKREIKKHGTN